MIPFFAGLSRVACKASRKNPKVAGHNMCVCTAAMIARKTPVCITNAQMMTLFFGKRSAIHPERGENRMKGRTSKAARMCW